MQKNSLIFLLSAVVLGIFGAFFHWLQVLNAFDNETGLHNPGSITSILVVIYIALAVLTIAGFCVFYLHAYKGTVSSAEEAMRAKSVLPTIAAWVCAAVMICGAVMTMLTSNFYPQPGFRRIFAAVAIFAGLAVPFTVCRADGKMPAISESASLVPPLFGCVWLVFSYKLNAENPVIWSYALEILSIAVLTYAYYNVCSYFYGRAKRPGKILFSILLAAFMCIMTLADSRPFPLQMIFIASAGMMLLYACMIFSNLKLKGVYPDKAE